MHKNQIKDAKPNKDPNFNPVYMLLGYYCFYMTLNVVLITPKANANLSALPAVYRVLLPRYFVVIAGISN